MVVKLFDKFIYFVFCNSYKYLVKHFVISSNYTYDIDFWGDIL